jgi:PAS domain S-box-containing protein
MPTHPEISQKLKDLTYRIVFEENNEMKIIIDRDGTILNANRVFSESFYKKSEDCIGLNVYSLFPQELVDERRKCAEKAFLTGKTQLFEDERKGRFFRHSLYPIPEENGIIDKLYVFSQDITGIKQAEKNTQKHSAFTKEAMEAFPGSYVVLDSRGSIIACNSYFRDVIAGQSNENLSGINTFDLFHPDDKPFAYEKLADILQKGTEESAELRILIHGGPEYRWFRISTKRIFVDDEIFLVSSGTDINEYKKKEQELSISNEQLRFILSESRTGSWDWDMKTNINKWTDEIWELYGLEKNSCEPSYESWKKSIVEDDRENIERQVFEASKKGIPFRIEWRVRYADGSLHWLMARGIPFKGTDGSVSRYVGIVIDITDLKKSEQMLKDSEERFRRLFRENSSIMLIIDAEDDRILEANKAAEEFYGWSSKELCSMKVEHLSTKSLETIRIEKEDIRSRNLRKLLSEHRLSNGSLRDVEVFSTPDILHEKPVFYCIINDITDRMLAEKQLFVSKAMLDTALESMNDALFIFDAENKLTEYNTAYALFLKFSDKKDCSTQLCRLENFPALFEVSMPDGTPAPLEQWAIPRALRGESCTHVEYHVRRKDTGQQWIGSYNFSPIRNRDGKIIGAVTTAHDITHNKKAEAALKESEERFRKFFEQHSAVMIVLDPETGNIVDVNNAAAEYYGWSREQLSHMSVTDINIDKPEDSLERVEGWRNAEKRTFTVTHRKADGSICDLEVFGQKIPVKERWLAYLILHDITERNRFQQALIETNERMHYVLQTVNAGIWDADLTTNESYWSDELWQLHGVEKNSFPLTHDFLRSTILREDRLSYDQTIADAVKNGAEFNGRWRIKDITGNVRWLMGKGNPVKDANGKVLRYVGIIIDITERMREEYEKKKLESRILKSERLETIGTLAGGIAHDFNNILTPIMGYAELGMIKLPDEDPLRQYFKEIMMASERAQNLVSQILTFSRAQESEPSNMSVQSIIDEALMLIRPTIPSTIAIEKHIDPACRNILADPSKIHQVIVNLCANAYQAMENSGGTLTIELEEVTPDKNLLGMLPELYEQPYAKLTISDTGYGIDRMTMDHIFEPFFTTKPVNKGTGLGLSVVHGIITGYKGVINVESQPGKGCSFQIFLPIVDHTVTGKEHKQVFSCGNASILFIDDEEPTCKMMTLMLTKLGHKVLSFSSPREALELFRQSPDEFNLVITDLTMPEMTGIKLASEIHAYKPEIPIILMTGFGKDIDSVKELDIYGIRQLIKKPIKIENIVSAINKICTPVTTAT